ncbi:MAG: hypothetical protein PPP56_12975 [Longimonas sp.]|uniref:hypothetical protein n=1 Tax=Longimonas sp. TaxID=2039626 RepID=UPI00334F61E9
MVLLGKALATKKKKENRLRQKGKIKRFWDAVGSSSEQRSGAVPAPAVQDGRSEKESVSSAHASQEIEEQRQEGEMPQGEVIAELREEVKELKEKVRKRDTKIMALRDQQNTSQETSAANKEEGARSRGSQSEPESEEMQEIVADLKIMISKKNDALEAKDKKLKQALEVVRAREEVGQENEDEQESTALAQRMAALGAENRRLQKIVNAFKARHSNLPEAARAPSADNKLATEAPSDKGTEVDSIDTGDEPGYAETRELLGQVFCAWCQQGRVMVGRYYMFERAMQETYPDATVSPIYHTPEADTPFQFAERRAVATFWLVEINGASFLLPVPRRDGTFEALEPAIQGSDDANPSDLIQATPAQLTTEGTGYRVAQKGTLVFETSGSSSA